MSGTPRAEKASEWGSVAWKWHDDPEWDFESLSLKQGYKFKAVVCIFFFFFGFSFIREGGVWL